MTYTSSFIVIAPSVSEAKEMVRSLVYARDVDMLKTYVIRYWPDAPANQLAGVPKEGPVCVIRLKGCDDTFGDGNKEWDRHKETIDQAIDSRDFLIEEWDSPTDPGDLTKTIIIDEVDTEEDIVADMPETKVIPVRPSDVPQDIISEEGQAQLDAYEQRQRRSFENQELND